jgi:large subunit ribosomal protein L15
MSILSKLKPPRGAKTPRFRVGRGVGSGNGKTCGRGMKGQGARTGYRGTQYFEGGQMPLQRRLPKRGFRNVLADVIANVNVGELEVFENGAEVTVDGLRDKGLLRGRFDAVKILGDGELTRKLTVKAHAFSAGAAAKIEQAGGKAEVVSRFGADAASTGSEG